MVIVYSNLLYHTNFKDVILKKNLACRSEIGSICAGRTAKVPQPHRPSTHQGSPSRSIPSASLPASCTENIQNICSGTPRHLSAICPSSWHKNHVPELCQPRQRLRCSLAFSSGEHGCPPPGLPRALEPPARRIQDHRDTGGEPGALGAAGDLPTAEDTSEAQNRQSFRAGTEQRFGEMLTSRPLEKGERCKGRVRHKTPPKGSGGTAGCCATFLLAQLRFRLLCACICLQPDSCFFLLRTQLSRGVYTKIWVFPVVFLQQLQNTTHYRLPPCQTDKHPAALRRSYRALG